MIVSYLEISQFTNDMRVMVLAGMMLIKVCFIAWDMYGNVVLGAP